MDNSLVIVIVLAVISLFGSITKKAQSKMEEDKRKEAAEKRGKKEQTPERAASAKSRARSADAQPALRGTGANRPTMQPFGGAPHPSDPSMQPGEMSTFFGDDKRDHRVVREETPDPRVTADGESIDIKYDKDSLLQGIILAEVLKRPTPGSFRRLPANR